ncbi:MAG: mechanosensitive ion channel domain-containing protein, partial [Cyanobium sp.]
MNPAFAPSVTAGQVGWVSLLIFGFPVAMVLLGEAIRRLQRQRSPYLPAVRILRNWLIPFLTLLVLLAQVIGLSRATVPVRLAETLVWISLIYGALTLLNGLLFTNAAEGTWLAKVPQIFRDLTRFILVLVGSSIVLSTVWGADLGGFLTALGVGSLVLGLALQDSLGNIFSGVALLFEQPIRLGDWVDIDGQQGKVVEVNWRAVHLLTSDGDLLVVPNSELGKKCFTNLSRPDENHIRHLALHFSLNDPPNAVKEVLERTALEIEGVLLNPPPKAQVASYNDFSITYDLEFTCANYGKGGGLAEQLLRRIWYVARREGLTIPLPTRVSMPYAVPVAELPETANEERLRGLRNSCFAALPQADLERLARAGLLREFATGEIVLREGAAISSLRLILRGEAELLVASQGGSELSVGILSPGECFGEQAGQLHNRLAYTT